MNITYSTYDIEAKISEVLEQVREGKTIVIYQDGEIFAEIHPVERRKHTTEERLEELERRGALVRSGKRWQPVTTGDPIPGAVERFLADRGE